jgi:hypothetical protein
MEGLMRKRNLIVLALFLTGCATTYHLPESRRSRTYRAEAEQVWAAAVASVDDAGLALVETEQEHGRIRARAGWSIWDLKGHVLLVVVRSTEDGKVRVDANAETVSEDEHIDFGRSGRIVRDYLEALDQRMVAGTG